MAAIGTAFAFHVLIARSHNGGLPRGRVFPHVAEISKERPKAHGDGKNTDDKKGEVTAERFALVLVFTHRKSRGLRAGEASAPHRHAARRARGTSS